MGLKRYKTMLLACLVLTGCASVYQELESGKLYRRDASVEINGKTEIGVVVTPQQTQYEFIVEPKGGIDLLILRTCHREYVAEKIDPGFLGLGGNKFKYTYIPVPGLEDQGYCPLRMDFFESAKEGRHSWAYVDFQNHKFTLPGAIYCSGTVKQFLGVTACQSKVGLIQKISFFEGPIQFHVKPDTCNPPKRVPGSGFDYEIKASPGECSYSFRNAGNNRGYLNLIGYTGILVREPQ